MNIGHVEWCMGNKKTAIDSYISSIKKSDLDFEWFTKVFEEDSKYLEKHGINPFYIPLMIDYVKMSVKE